MNIHKELSRRCAGHPVESQREVADPMVFARLFYPGTRGACYVTEYGPERNIAFGYVTGVGSQGWGYVPIPQLLAYRLPWGIGLEVDLRFEPKRASELGLLR